MAMRSNKVRTEKGTLNLAKWCRDDWWVVFIYFHSEIGESGLRGLARTEARMQWVKKKTGRIQSWSERKRSSYRGLWSSLHEDGNNLNVLVKC